MSERVRPVRVLDRIWLVHRTAAKAGSGTGALFEIRFTDREGNERTKDVPNLPYNERKPGFTDMYDFDVRDLDILETTEITLAVNTFVDDSEHPPTDLWRPDRIFVFAKTTENEWVVLAHHEKEIGAFDYPNGNYAYKI